MAIGSGITLNDYKGKIKDLARPNRFLLTFPTSPFTVSADLPFSVRSASLPGRTIGDITNLYWQGMNFKIAGDPTYDDYTVMFLNSVKFDIKSYVEEWIDAMANSINNERTSHTDYKGTIQLEQLGRGTDILATYYMHGVYPKSIEAIELSQETVDAVEEFSTTWSVDYWSTDPTYGSGDGFISAGTPSYG